MGNVAVIGASIGGLSAALELLKRGLKVSVFDKKSEIGDHTVCGGAIANLMLDSLGEEIKGFMLRSEIASISRVRLLGPNNSRWEINSEKEPLGHILDRVRLERLMASEVEGYGGKIFLERNIHNLSELNSYEYIVGADGLFGVTKFMHFHNLDNKDMHLCAQITVGYPDTTRSAVKEIMVRNANMIELVFGHEIAPLGYAWTFPTVSGQARVGLGIPMSEKANVRRLLEKFVAFHDVNWVPVGEPVAKVVSTSMPPDQLAYKNVVLVGDAGRLCDPLTGGGIANAIISGQAAGKAISLGKLSKYDSYISSLKHRNRIRYKMKEMFYGMEDGDIEFLFRSLEDYTPPEISSTKQLTRVMMNALFHVGLSHPGFFIKHRALRRAISMVK